MPWCTALVAVAWISLPLPATAGGARATISAADLRVKPEDDWSRLLLPLLPAINACLRHTPAPSHVTKAWPMNRGMVGVRTRDRRGGWFACVAPTGGGTVARFEALSPGTDRLPGENTVVFVPAGSTPLTGECYQHEQVVHADGTLVGWLAYDTC